MKKLFFLVVLSSQAMAAQTLDEALAKTRARFELKDHKKAARDAIKAKYKTEMQALRASQKAELGNVK